MSKLDMKKVKKIYILKTNEKPHFTCTEKSKDTLKCGTAVMYEIRYN